jgi:cell volume regulation protein A
VASYLLGLILSETKIPKKERTADFYVSFSWLAQTGMFLLLGMQLFPAQIARAASYAWLPGLFLFLAARPLGVMISYLPVIKAPFRKRLFVSWVGLKGATPVVFALIPLIAGVPRADLILDMVAVIVIASMVIHGFTLKPAAQRFRLLEEERSESGKASNRLRR